MPKPGLHPMVKGKLESTQPKMANRSADPSFVSDHEFVELVWDNGQVLMQGQSSRTRKNPSCTGFSSHTSNAQEKDGGNTITPKIGRFGDTVLNDFSSFLPLSHMGLGQDDEMVRWLNCPFEDSMQHDYSSEFFSELSGDDLNALSVKNNAIPTDKSSNYGQLARDSHKVSVHGDANQEQGNVSKVIGEGPESARPRNSPLCSSSLQQCETSVRSLRPRISNFISSTTSNALPAPCENSSQSPISARQLPNMKMEKQDLGLTRSPLQPSSNMDLMNFSHFSRPAALVKANLQSISAAASLGLSGVDRLGNNDKVSAVGISNAAESTLIESSGSKSTVFQSHPVSMPTEVNLKPAVGKPSNETLSAEQSEAFFQEEAFRNNRSPDQVLGRTSSFAASSALVRPDSGSAIEPVVAASSVCSGSSAGGPSNDPKHTSKRKFRDAEESECQSEDVEEESVGGRKPALARGGTGAKKSRAAEVHNLSERKRRDRINEKMRALQELIPNCNKVDKASMLDEAIEYLKSLQLQVQIMSMGNGFYMPPMMLPTGMQHIHASHMAHFSPMSIGMGMGMGMGMGVGFGTGGMLDMSGGSSGCPMMQVPHMHRPQFRCPPISGPTSLPGMVGSSLQMFGLPGQGLPLAMPHAPFLPPGGLSAKSVSAPNVYGVATPVEAPDSVLPSTTKDPIQNSNSEIMNKTITECSQNLSSTQATKEGCEQSDLVQRNDQPSHVKSDKASNSIN